MYVGGQLRGTRLISNVARGLNSASDLAISLSIGWFEPSEISLTQESRRNGLRLPSTTLADCRRFDRHINPDLHAFFWRDHLAGLFGIQTWFVPRNDRSLSDPTNADDEAVSFTRLGLSDLRARAYFNSF
jgi:hypothetical protein